MISDECDSEVSLSVVDIDFKVMPIKGLSEPRIHLIMYGMQKKD